MCTLRRRCAALLSTYGDFVAKNNKSIRYFEFNSNNEVMKEYRAVFHTLVSRLYSRMMNKVTPWADLRGKSDPPEMSNGGFWTLWADNATSVSESASSEVGATKLAAFGLIWTALAIYTWTLIAAARRTGAT